MDTIFQIKIFGQKGVSYFGLCIFQSVSFYCVFIIVAIHESLKHYFNFFITSSTFSNGTFSMRDT